MIGPGRKLNRYVQIIEQIFLERYKEGETSIPFERDDLVRHAKRLKIKLPKNLGDIVYTFRYRGVLPESITNKAPKGLHWIIRGTGRAKYSFALARQPVIAPNEIVAETKVPDATPGVIAMYALSDEQALLAKLRYNRLVDVFSGVTCYSLQSHLRTSVPGVGQVETDELYVGVDKKGVHYIFPVQAKGGQDKLSIVQIEQDLAMCRKAFPHLVCRPIAAQFMRSDLIALFELTEDEEGIAVVTEKHYRLVPPDQLSPDELRAYQQRGD